MSFARLFPLKVRSCRIACCRWPRVRHGKCALGTTSLRNPSPQVANGIAEGWGTKAAVPNTSFSLAAWFETQASSCAQETYRMSSPQIA